MVVFWREKVSEDETGDTVTVGYSVLFVVGEVSVCLVWYLDRMAASCT